MWLPRCTLHLLLPDMRLELIVFCQLQAVLKSSRQALKTYLMTTLLLMVRLMTLIQAFALSCARPREQLWPTLQKDYSYYLSFLVTPDVVRCSAGNRMVCFTYVTDNYCVMSIVLLLLL